MRKPVLFTNNQVPQCIENTFSSGVPVKHCSNMVNDHFVLIPLPERRQCAGGGQSYTIILVSKRAEQCCDRFFVCPAYPAKCLSSTRSDSIV